MSAAAIADSTWLMSGSYDRRDASKYLTARAAGWIDPASIDLGLYGLGSCDAMDWNPIPAFRVNRTASAQRQTCQIARLGISHQAASRECRVQRSRLRTCRA